MRHHISRGLLAGLTVSTLTLAACGSDSKSTTNTTSQTAVDDTAAVDQPATTNVPAAPALIGADGTAEITVTVGVDDFDTSGGKRVVSVPKGTAVTISLTDLASEQMYHLHGYDLEQDAAKGATAKISFTADQTGQFDLESHNTEAALLVLVVI